MHDQGLWRASEERRLPGPLQRGIKECCKKGPPGPGGPQDGREGPKWVRERERAALCLRLSCGDLDKYWMFLCIQWEETYPSGPERPGQDRWPGGLQLVRYRMLHEHLVTLSKTISAFVILVICEMKVKEQLNTTL